MKVRFRLTFAFIFVCLSNCIAQNSEPKKSFKHSFIGFTAGPSVPLGQFSNTNFYGKESGFADQGMSYNLNLNLLLGKHAGLGLLISSYSNPVNESELKKGYTQTGIGEVSLSTSNWKVTGIFLGVITSFPEGGRFAFNMRAMPGFAFCASPEINVAVQGGNSATQESLKQITFAFDLGLMLSYNLSKSFGVLAGADFIAASPKFDYLYASSSDELRQKMNVFNLSGGIAYMF